MPYQDIDSGVEGEKWAVEESTATLGKEDSFVPVSIRILKEDAEKPESLGILFTTVATIVTAVISVTSAIIGRVQRKKMREAEQKRADNIHEIQKYLISLVGAYNLRMKENRKRLNAISKTLSGLGSLTATEKNTVWVRNGGIIQNGYSEMINYGNVSLSGEPRDNLKVFQGVSGATLKPLQFSKGSVAREIENIHRVNGVSLELLEDAKQNQKEYILANPEVSSRQKSARGRAVVGKAERIYKSELIERWSFFSNQCELYGIKVIWTCKTAYFKNSFEDDNFLEYVKMQGKKIRLVEFLENVRPLTLYKKMNVGSFWAVRGGWGSSNDVWVKVEEWLGGNSNYHLSSKLLTPDGVFSGKTICKVSNSGRLEWDTHLDTRSDNQLSVYELGKKLQSYADDLDAKFSWSQLAGVPYWCVYAYMVSENGPKMGYNQAENDTVFLKNQVDALAVARKIQIDDTTTDSGTSGGIPVRDSSSDNRALIDAQKKTDSQKNSIKSKLIKFWSSEENQKKTKIGLGLGLGAYLIGRK